MKLKSLTKTLVILGADNDVWLPAPMEVQGKLIGTQGAIVVEQMMICDAQMLRLSVLPGATLLGTESSQVRIVTTQSRQDNRKRVRHAGSTKERHNANFSYDWGEQP